MFKQVFLLSVSPILRSSRAPARRAKEDGAPAAIRRRESQVSAGEPGGEPRRTRGLSRCTLGASHAPRSLRSRRMLGPKPDALFRLSYGRTSRSKNGAPGTIRTCDSQLRRLMLYPD